MSLCRPVSLCRPASLCPLVSLVPLDPEVLKAKLARAEGERDAAVTALDKRGRREQRGGLVRRVIVGALVVLFAILVPITATLTWAHYTVLNSDGFENTVGPLVSNPAVQAAVSTRLTNQIFDSLNAQGRVTQALPPRATFLGAPITNAAKGYVQTGVNKIVQSKQFQTLWLQATRFAHSELVGVLRGKNSTVNTTDGKVVLNLVPLLNDSLGNIQGFVSGVVGKPVKLPTISADDIPAAACQKIATAIDRPVPSTCGQIPLFPATKLVQARRAVKAFDRSLLLLIVTPALAAVAILVSRRRRRTLLQLTVAGVLGLVIVRRVIVWLQHTLVNTGLPQFKDARDAIMTQVLHGFFDITRWLLVALIVVFVVAVLAGPYAWAVKLRSRAGNLAESAVGHGHADSTTDWVRSHLDLLRFTGVAIAIIVILAAPVSFVGIVIIAALLIIYELAVHGLARRAPAPDPPPNATPTPTAHTSAN